jgi:cation:H+ antiporter
MSVVAVVAGLVLLVAGAEALVRGASKLAAALGISPLVIGLTVVAFGTSTPELAVGAQAALDGQTDLAMGNVTGSNQFNMLGVLGVSALISVLVVRQKLVRRELPLLVGVSAAVFIIALGGEIARWEGALLIVGLVVYTVWAIMVERRVRAAGTVPVGDGVALAGDGCGRYRHRSWDVRTSRRSHHRGHRHVIARAGDLSGRRGAR